MKKVRLTGLLLLVIALFVMGETTKEFPITEDIAIGNDGAKKYVTCLNSGDQTDLAACNFTC